MNKNPYNLKTNDNKPANFLNADEFISFLNKKKILIKRKDNLPRFCKKNNIQMTKVRREGSFGTTPTVFKQPSESKIQEILEIMRNNNNSLLGREILKKKKEKILDIFDKAKDKVETRTSIAKKVSESLNVSCDRKLVRAVLNSKRSSKLDKLKKKD